jgi:hypothetical protein
MESKETKTRARTFRVCGGGESCDELRDIETARCTWHTPLHGSPYELGDYADAQNDA